MQPHFYCLKQRSGCGWQHWVISCLLIYILSAQSVKCYIISHPVLLPTYALTPTLFCSHPLGSVPVLPSVSILDTLCSTFCYIAYNFSRHPVL